MRTTLRLVTEAVVFLLWVATAVLMLRPKGGCDVRATVDKVDKCGVKGTDRVYFHSDQPLARWDIGIGFDFVEM